MAVTVAKLGARRGRHQSAEAGGPTVRAAIDTFLDSPDVRANPNTLRAYTSVLEPRRRGDRHQPETGRGAG